MTAALVARKDSMQKIASRHTRDVLDAEMLTRLARGIATSHPGEIGCDECFEQLDQFADVTLAGKDAAEILPGVQDHLHRCADCREEFEALLTALRAED
jgi:hypothetical protein